ncbi:MAG: hypothetical protein IJ092_05350 [Atopobiaceae bacterium]|nr:hypothetical protein [Atopobiaceae bacterium]MBQ9317431.1 hypothetical protein [Atopobiaceae bacterium]
MARDQFIGVKNFHLAELTDEENLTYGTPVAIAGLVQMQASRATNNEPSYADDEVWIEEESDTGGEGTISIRDILSNQDARELIARLSGYLVTAEGDLLAIVGASRNPCAILCERSAHSGHGQRKLWYCCTLGKPEFDASTKEETPTAGQLDIPFTYRPIKLAEGISATTRDSFYGNSTYAGFFDAVVKTTAAKSE